MRLLVFGATGGTGREIVAQGLEQGHAITAFARNPADIAVRHDNLNVVRGDVLDYPSVEAATRDQEAVLSALGARSLGKTTLLSEGTRNMIRAMERHGVRRFICESSLGVGDSKGQLGPLFDWIVLPLMLRHIYRDKEVQERLIKESNLDWVIVRPAALTNGSRTGVYRIEFRRTGGGLIPRISRADVADFMLKQLASDAYVRKTPGLWY